MNQFKVDSRIVKPSSSSPRLCTAILTGVPLVRNFIKTLKSIKYSKESCIQFITLVSMPLSINNN